MVTKARTQGSVGGHAYILGAALTPRIEFKVLGMVQSTGNGDKGTYSGFCGGSCVYFRCGLDPSDRIQSTGYGPKYWWLTSRSSLDTEIYRQTTAIHAVTKTDKRLSGPVTSRSSLDTVSTPKFITKRPPYTRLPKLTSDFLFP